MQTQKAVFAPAELRRRRKAAQLSQERLARLIGRSSLSISQWERGVWRPSLDSLTRLAAVFAVPLDDLLEPVAHKIAAQAPALTDDQRARMRVLLRNENQKSPRAP